MNDTDIYQPRTLLIGSSLKGGGAETRLNYLAENLFHGNIDICLLQDNGDQSREDKRARKFDLRWKSELSYPRIIYHLRKIIKIKRYDIIMSFGLFPNLIVWFATRCFTNRPKIIMHEITRPQMELLWTTSYIKKIILRKLRKVSYSEADVLTANSTDGIEECIRYFNVKTEKTVRLPNLIDPYSLRLKAKKMVSVSLPQDTFVISVASRLDKMKRIDTLIESVSRLPDDLNCVLVVVGDGHEMDNIRQQVKYLGLDNKVIFTGWQDNPLPIISCSTLYVLCSEYEGFSNSVLEAMFLGVPVITSLCSSDAIEMCDIGAAKGFEPGDVSELTVIIDDLLRNPDERELLVQRAFQYCKIHEIDSALSFYENLLRHTVAGNPGTLPEIIKYEL
jgi:glycosyltransferase involved in cell wall biosynthesis